MRKLTFGLGVASIATGLLVGVAQFAPTQVQAARQAVIQVTTSVVDTVIPAPSPSPTPVVVQPTLIPVQQPVVSTPIPPQGPQPFPAPDAMPTSPPQLQAPNQPSQATPVPIPQTYVSIAVISVNGASPQVDKNTGGYTGQPGMVVVYQAYFQGGFSGVTPQFTWTGGGTGSTFTVTYSTVGVYHETLKVDEVYNGVTYEAGSVNSVPITICTSGATNASGGCA